MGAGGIPGVGVHFKNVSGNLVFECRIESRTWLALPIQLGRARDMRNASVSNSPLALFGILMRGLLKGAAATPALEPELSGSSAARGVAIAAQDSAVVRRDAARGPLRVPTKSKKPKSYGCDDIRQDDC